MNTVIEKIEPMIYVGTYEKYNNGSIAGKWLSLNDYDDLEGFYKACKELHNEEHDPEFMFQDFEYIPKSMIGESWIDPEFYNLLNEANMSHIDYEVYLSAVDHGLSWETLQDSMMILILQLKWQEVRVLLSLIYGPIIVLIGIKPLGI